MQKVIKLWFAFALSAGLLASCSQDGREPSVATDGGGETVTLSLSAEVSVDDPNLRAINYKLGKNSKDQLVPMPQFVDKQEVDVHTIIKSSTGGKVAKTLKWKYDATKRKLVLSPTNKDISLDANNMVVSGFNNDGGVKWYISGLIGGELVPGTTKVTFAGERVLKGVVGNEGDIVGSLNVPYSFGWTELSINTTDTRDSNGSHKYAKVPEETDVKFVPRGSLIAYKLGNAQTAGSYSFTAQGFSVGSNAWGDQGDFELNTDIPSSDPHKQLPTWKESSCASMYYTFATGHAPSTISANGTADKIYYAWVMSHSTQPASAEVRVMLKGESSRQATATYKDYTKTWFTDYSPKNTGTQGKVTQGQVHSLTAKATHRLAIPIEYVTDYNLAGGEGLTYMVTPGTISGHLNSPAFGGVQPAGVTGSLRFANSHSNDQSGYYNWYKVVGRQHVFYNHVPKNLQTAVDEAFGAGKYFIPTLEQWWGIFPSARTWYQNWSGASERLNTKELMCVGLDADVLRQAYFSDYSQSFTSPHGGSDATDNAVFYAIRFKARTDVCAPEDHAWDYDATTNIYKSYTYASALDNSMKCAYRFTRVGGKTSWELTSNRNLTNQLRIDVVYLGDEASPTDLSAISNEAWWSTKSSEQKVISKVFPASGNMHPGYSFSVSGSLGDRGYGAYYWSSSQESGLSAWVVVVVAPGVYSRNMWNLEKGLPVRLFVRRNQ